MDVWVPIPQHEVNFNGGWGTGGNRWRRTLCVKLTIMATVYNCECHCKRDNYQIILKNNDKRNVIFCKYPVLPLCSSTISRSVNDVYASPTTFYSYWFRLVAAPRLWL